MGQSSSDCLRYAVWKEARGEGLKTQRAVLDVIFNRMKKSGKKACAVLREKGQFPYFKNGVKKVLDRKFLKKYNVIVKMRRVLPNSYLYFNHVRHKWGKDTVKIGKLYFSR